MTTTYASNIQNGSTLAFEAARDTLVFDLPGVSAADLRIGSLHAGDAVLFQLPTLSFTLAGADLFDLGRSDLRFADGSLFVHTNAGNRWSTALAGGAGNDLLVGSQAPQGVQLASVTANGAPGVGSGSPTFLSADGRFVVFQSFDENLVPGIDDGYFLRDMQAGETEQVYAFGEGIDALAANGRLLVVSDRSAFVPGDANGVSDVYVKDLDTGVLTLVSRGLDGGAAGGFAGSISANGRFVAFENNTGGVTPGDVAGPIDVFVRDMVTGATVAVAQGNGKSNEASISADGRFVAFTSRATNLLISDTNANEDIYVRGLVGGTSPLVLASVSSDEVAGSGVSLGAALSADGRFVAFQSTSTLVAGDTNAKVDIYVRDLVAGTTIRASTNASGGQSNADSTNVAISGDGRYVVFLSAADNLVAGDTNLRRDVFVKDLVTGAIARVSVDASGAPTLRNSVGPTISADGSHIAFAVFSGSELPGSAAEIIVVDNPLLARTLTGGAGNDTYVIANANDAVVEAASAGTDTVRSSVSFVLPVNVERLELSGSANLAGTGNALDNLITGNAGNNRIDGGSGSDTVSYATAADGVVIDLSLAGPQDSGGAGVDELIGIENVTGSAFDDVLFGNALANVLTGGTGADLMAGGAGNDVYWVDQPGDIVVEDAGEGSDTVNSTVSWTLGDNVEGLQLRGSANVNGTGNGLDNFLAGNRGANTLDGGAGTDTVSYASATSAVSVGLDRTSFQNVGGGRGADRLLNIENLSGSFFDDTLHGNAGDNLLNGLGGVDTLSYARAGAAVTVSLATGAAQATGGAGTDTVVSFENLTGSGFDDSLTGSATANRIDGGAGNDTLVGGDGGDTYFVDSALDVIVEEDPFVVIITSPGGPLAFQPVDADLLDTVRSTAASYTLAANVEVLTLLGTLAIDGTGNADDNILTGNSAENRLDGADGDDLIDGAAGADTMNGGDGDDEFRVDDAGDVVVELGGGGKDLVRSAVSYTLGADVEDLELLGTAALNGTGNDLDNRLTGNGAANRLDGGAANDTLAGGGGNDTLVGGDGNDLYLVGSAVPVITEAVGGGIDTVVSEVSTGLSALNVENLTLAGAALNGDGNFLDNRLVGNALDNKLQGGDGNDTLDGGTGKDTLVGGAGNDVFFVDSTDDVAADVSGATGGFDTVNASATTTLDAFIERLVLTGTAAINGTGNADANEIVGNDAANTLDGGLGADVLTGGGGNDSYVVNIAGDQVVEAAGGGTDTVLAGSSYTLGVELEDLTLTGASAINGTGNGLNNRITGNAANNALNGGTGADTMTGGGGNDSYTVDNAGDVVVEAAGGGVDTLVSLLGGVLAAEVENLVLGGASAIDGTGNALGNELAGNAAANVLDGAAGVDTVSYASFTAAVTASLASGTASGAGGNDTLLNIENLIGGSGNDSLTGNGGSNALNGGSGVDTLTGGAGNDSYTVDNVADIVVELAAGGSDTVTSLLTLTLGTEVENGVLGGVAAINGTGNGLANRLTGNTANNVLDGGAGADTMVGGTGADTFRLGSLVGSDTVSDFVTGTDKILVGQGGLPIGDGDTLVEGGVTTAGTGGFTNLAELVDVGTQVIGSLTTASAATAIGSATAAYTIGRSVLFAVDNGTSTALFRFVAADANALVSSTELTLLATLTATPNVVLGDLLFGV